MNLRYSIFTICFSLLCCCAIPLPACGPSIYADEGRMQLFRNGLDGLKGLEPFYYSERFLNSYSADPGGEDYKRNCAEWRQFTGNKASIDDIYAIQYDTDPKAFLDACAKGDRKFFGNNTLMLWLLLKENKAALDYMILAKRAESTQFRDADPWVDSAKGGQEMPGELAGEALNRCRQVKQQFLKERYAFQALKMAYYAGPALQNRQPVLDLYPALLDKSTSVVLGWAQLFYGMQQRDPLQQTIYLLRSFDHSEEKKVFCYQQIGRTTLDSIMPFIKDPYTLELLHVVKGMKTYGSAFEQIKAVYTLNPQSKYLPLLLTREVNKLEDWIWSPELLGFNGISFEDGTIKRAPYNKPYAQQDSGYAYYAKLNLDQDKKRLSELLSFLEKTTEAPGRNKDFVTLCIAHLHNISGNYEQARQWTNTLDPMQDKHYEIQRLIEATIAFAYTEEVTTPAAKDRIATNLLRMNELNPAFLKSLQKGSDPNRFYSADGEEEYDDDMAELFLLLSNRYKAQGDLLTAGLLYTKAAVMRNTYDGWADTSDANYQFIAYFDREATPATIDSLLAFKYAKRRTVFEGLIAPVRWANEDFYRDLKGTILVRREQYHEALAVFAAMDPNFWETHYEYKSYLPITTITSLGTLSPWDEPQQARYYTLSSKKQIVAEVTRLQDSLNLRLPAETKAKLNYRLGHALYSLSYYGKAWMMMSYGRTSREQWQAKGDFAYYSFYPNSLRYGNNYYGCANAMAAYNKALNLSRNKELKAKCLLSLTLCDNAAQYMRDSRNGLYTPQPYRSAYLQQLERRYAGTMAYEAASTTCPDIARTGY